MDSWKYHWLRIDGVYFEDTKEMIVNAMGFAMQSKTQKKHPKGMDEMSLQIFFVVMKMLCTCMVDLLEKWH